MLVRQLVQQHAKSGAEPVLAPDDLTPVPHGGETQLTVPRWRGAKYDPSTFPRVGAVPLVRPGNGIVTWQALVNDGLLVFLTRDRNRVQCGDVVIQLADKSGHTGIAQIVSDQQTGKLQAHPVSYNTNNFTFLHAPQVNRMWLYVQSNQVSIGVGSVIGQFTATSAHFEHSVCTARFVSFASTSARGASLFHLQTWAMARGYGAQ